DTPAAAAALPALLGSDGAALSLQNGLGNAERLAEVLGPARVLGGVTSQAPRWSAPAGSATSASGRPSSQRWSALARCAPRQSPGCATRPASGPGLPKRLRRWSGRS